MNGFRPILPKAPTLIGSKPSLARWHAGTGRHTHTYLAPGLIRAIDFALHNVILQCTIPERQVSVRRKHPMANTPNYEIPGEMRDFAEKSVEQARKAIDGFMGAVQKT